MGMYTTSVILLRRIILAASSLLVASVVLLTLQWLLGDVPAVAAPAELRVCL